MQAPRRAPKPATSVLLACCTVALACGCGSSGGSGAGTSSHSTAKPPSALKSRLQPTTTPRYAAPAASAPVQSGTVQIAYRNIAIAPDTLRVKAGTTVRWTNYDPVEHNVTSRGGAASFASGNFGEGKTFEVKLTRPGVVHYLCTIHPTTMNGTIEVR
ncbi:MAG TPA: plastocyanin/azurin family copper-binding protein [Solirubrobacteraceae bacterium]|nr:plastocyanin/azurin family copper-binding protein [Solirubrobacteraceae bacterium]